MPKLCPNCAQNPRKISKRPAELNLVTMQGRLRSSFMLKFCTMGSFNSRIKYGNQLHFQTTKAFKERGLSERDNLSLCGRQKTRGFCSHTPPNGCEHFLNIACGGCIRKVKGLAGITMRRAFSHLIYKFSL